jgi:putative endonuclease
MFGLWRKILGSRGERAAERFLKRQGHRILARNFRSPGGEIDLITLDGRTLVFVEVKTRRSNRHAEPEESVNHDKQRRVIQAARFYRRAKGADHLPCRFDVVAIVMGPSGRRQLRHIPDAFSAMR